MPITPIQTVRRRPRRLRQSTSRGARVPSDAVVVSQSSRWASPFVPGTPEAPTPADAVALYRQALYAGDLHYSTGDVRRALLGRDLVCWCPLDQPCHADVLLKVAN